MTQAKRGATAVISVALILGSSSMIAAQAPQRWRVGTPIATYYAGPPITDAVARQMGEGGFNLIWCAETEMDAAKRLGLRVLLQDGLLRPETLDDPAQLAKLDALIARARNHPSLYAYYIIDEPSAALFPALGKLVIHLREQDPAHMAYINLFPTYASNEQLGVKGETIPAYQEYLRQFIGTVKPELLSYDHYHYKVEGDGDQYFLNLGIIRQAALDAGIPFLNIVQACTWDKSMRAPNGDEMRWLNYTSLAYGAQGLSYFVYYYQPFYQEFKDKAGQMMRTDGTTTPQYEAAKVLNPQFVAVASQLQPLLSLGAYHVGKVPWGAQALPAQAPFRLDLSATSNSPMPESGMLLSYFGKPDSSGKPCQPTHVLVVNLDYRNTVTTTVVGPGQLEAFDAVQRTWERTSRPQTTLALPPGAGKLLRVSPR